MTSRGKVPKVISFVFLCIAIFVFVFSMCFLIALRLNYSNGADGQTTDVVEDEPEPEPEPEPEILEINFQPIVDEWVNSVSGNRSVLIYDLDLDKIVGEYNIDKKYNTASLYKLFVVYEGYRRLSSGEWSADEMVSWTEKNVLECLDLSIRESYSPCAESLWNMIGHDELDDIIFNDFGITDSKISSLSSNPADILKIMQLFYSHEEIADEALIARMKDSFLNQSATTYNWRQGLPTGFNVATVYDKVGWDYNADEGYWDIYHDAAIIDFPEQNRHFIVIVMTNYVSHLKIRNFGTMFENYFLENFIN